MKKTGRTIYTCDCCYNSLELSKTEDLKPLKIWGWDVKKVGDKSFDLCNKCLEVLKTLNKSKDADSIKCPECDSTVMRQKCMWKFGGDCPRHELADKVRKLKNLGLIDKVKNVF